MKPSSISSVISKNLLPPSGLPSSALNARLPFTIKDSISSGYAITAYSPTDLTDVTVITYFLPASILYVRQKLRLSLEISSLLSSSPLSSESTALKSTSPVE